MFNWLKSLGRARAESHAPEEKTLALARQPTTKDAFADAALSTDWVDEYLIRAIP
jgi:hypothetical protein